VSNAVRLLLRNFVGLQPTVTGETDEVGHHERLHLPTTANDLRHTSAGDVPHGRQFEEPQGRE
jgi:hypothetical protein